MIDNVAGVLTALLPWNYMYQVNFRGYILNMQGAQLAEAIQAKRRKRAATKHIVTRDGWGRQELWNNKNGRQIYKNVSSLHGVKA